MERMKQGYSWIKDLFESLSFFENAMVAFGAWLVAHINVCTGIVAFIVVLFQLRVVYYNGKLKKKQYENECKGE